MDAFSSPSKLDGKFGWSGRPAVHIQPAYLCNLCQFSKHLIMLPSISALEQRCLVTREDVLEAGVGGVAKGAGLCGTKPLVEALGTTQGVVCHSDQEAEPGLRDLPQIRP